MAHAVVRTDKLAGTDVRSGLVSAKYMGTGSTATDIDNGNVVLLNGLMTETVGGNTINKREVYKAVKPAVNSPLDQIVLVASPEIRYDVREKALDKFYNEAGEIFRGYHLHVGDIFSVTAEALAGSDIEAGYIVELQAGTKLKAVEELTQGSTKVGEIIDVETAGMYEYYVIEVK